MKIYIFRIIIAIFLLFGAFNLYSQSLTISAKPDTNIIVIGDQMNINLQVIQPKDFVIHFPDLQDTIMEKVEIISKSKIDTIDNGNELQLSQQYLVTCFDSGYYLIPPFNFTFNFPDSDRIDTAQTIPFYIGVQTIQLDTTNAIADIKQPIGAPITFREILPYAGLGFVVLIIGFMVIMFIRSRKGRESIFIKRQKPKDPAHIIAYSKLDELRDKKLWQQGKVKEYYTQLTDTLRLYLELRFDIYALEMTSDEILEALKNSISINVDEINELQDILHQSDFVKFAKANPLADININALKNAYIFIDKTKVKIELEEDSKNLKQELTPELTTEK